MKLFKRFVLLGWFVVAGSFIGVAETTCLRVCDIYGNNSYFVADETLQLIKEGEDILISLPNSEVRMKASQLKEFNYEPRMLSEIGDVAADASYIHMEGNLLRITSSKEGISTCYIYDMNGVVVTSLDYADEALIDMNSYSPGIYLIKTENVPTIKFVVK